MSEMIEVECPNCGEKINVNMEEFVDVTENPEYKAAIIEGDFFMRECPGCGQNIMVEYPVMYMDPSRKLNIYMAPDHEDDMLEHMNSLEIHEPEIDEEAIFRLTSSGIQLMEKILIAEHGRDDRLIELYKFVLWDNVKEEWPELEYGDLLYMFDEDGEYLVIWTSENEAEEKLTIPIEEELYDDLKSNYMEMLAIPPNEYAEVDLNWIGERFTR